MRHSRGSLAKIQVYLGAPGCSAETFRHALGLAVELAASCGHTNVTLSVPTLGHTQGDFDEVLGEAAASKLRRNYQLTAGKLTIHLATSRRRPHFTGPIVAAWTRPEQIRELLYDEHCAALIVVPWTETDVHHVISLAPAAKRF